VKGDRRALFFLLFAGIAALLIPVAEAEHRWVAEVVAITYVVLAAASALDAWSRARR
jgi:aryl carrier-like protein